jgi:hypothetical protein
MENILQFNVCIELHIAYICMYMHHIHICGTFRFTTLKSNF